MDTAPPLQAVPSASVRGRLTLQELILLDPSKIGTDPNFEAWERACATGQVGEGEAQLILQLLSDHEVENLERLESDFKTTGNALFALHALDYCHQPPAERLIDLVSDAQRRASPPETAGWLLELLGQHPSRLPYPEWCVNYIGRSVTKIVAICNIPKVKMSVGQKAKKVSEAFELTGNRRNAFREYERLMKVRVIKDVDESLHDRGYSHRRIREFLKPRLMVSDDRTIQRMIKSRPHKSP